MQSRAGVKFVRLFVTATASFWLLNSGIAGAQEPTPIDAAARAYAIAEIHSAVDVYFSHWAPLDRTTVKEAFKAYVREAFATDDRRRFDFATLRFFATLKNGHTAFSDAWLTHRYGQQIGFYARPLQGSWTVMKTSVASVAPGDVLEKIDGEPLDEFARRQGSYLAASSERERSLDLFKHGYLFPQHFVASLGGGRSVTIDRAKAFEQTFSDTESRWLPGNIGYIGVHSFLHQQFEDAAVQAVRRFANAPAIIVDVRGNGGGVTPDALIQSLMDRPIVTLSESSSVNIALFRADAGFITGRDDDPSLDLAPPLAGGTLSWSNPTQQPSRDAYRGRVLILTDGGCASACEDFVAPFKITHRATILGETTYGSTGQPYFETLPDGMSFHVSAKRDFFPDGSPFEGVGIAPDLVVEPTRVTLEAGRDPVLERAIQYAHEHAA
jgi:carboxyl-terminal processing protease